MIDSSRTSLPSAAGSAKTGIGMPHERCREMHQSPRVCRKDASLVRPLRGEKVTSSSAASACSLCTRRNHCAVARVTTGILVRQSMGTECRMGIVATCRSARPSVTVGSTVQQYRPARVGPTYGRSDPSSSSTSAPGGAAAARQAAASSAPWAGAQWTAPEPADADTKSALITRRTSLAASDSGHGCWYTRPTRAVPAQRGASGCRCTAVGRSSLVRRSRASRATQALTQAPVDVVTRTVVYSRSGDTAMATLAGMVHGVVVHTSMCSPGPPVTAPSALPSSSTRGTKNQMDLSVLSAYSSSASASTVRDEGDQWMGLVARYRFPWATQSASRPSTWPSYAGSMVL
mmetsp:Transcript_623/g.1935  ORF Transcript_623/g.1935 Transcript_623/m.1935 type:complete len:346 (+) Transcript_623:129-1166(+)